MANNPYVNKVDLADGTTLIDLTSDTVTAGKMLSGITAHDASGAEVTGTIANGTITNNTSGGSPSGMINRGNQIKIGAGYYSSNKYYVAQANAGTKTITSSGDISVDGYKTASVRTASSISMNGGTLSGTNTISGTGIITSGTDQSGVAINSTCNITLSNMTIIPGETGWFTGVAFAGKTSESIANKYLSGVTITAPPIGTRTFTITVPNGSSTVNFVFNVDSSGNVTITES